MRTNRTARVAFEPVSQEQLPAAKLPQPITQAAPLMDVMMEQIRYLAGHTTQPCPAGCADCVRLEQAKRWLLAPFQ